MSAPVPPASAAELDATRRVSELINGYQQTCVIVAATELGVFARLAAGPLTESALADALSLSATSTHRLVLALRSLELIEGSDTLALSKLGEMLVPNTRGLAEAAVLVGREYLQGWSGLRYSLETGKPAFDHVFGMDAWEHRRVNPELGRAFNLMTSGLASSQLRSLVETYDFGTASHIVDVGGGRGYLLAAILGRHEHVRGTLFDQPHVVSDAEPVLAAAGVTGRCTVTGGSFLQAVPAGGDLYILKHILHDWNDEISAAILAKVREVMSPGGRLLVIESLLPDEKFADPMARMTIMLDLHMMTILGGRERHAAEYERLLVAAGFELARVIPVTPTTRILEARAAKAVAR